MHSSVPHGRNAHPKQPPRIYMRQSSQPKEPPRFREKDPTLSHILASLMLLVLVFIGLRATATADQSPSPRDVAPAAHISRPHSSL